MGVYYIKQELLAPESFPTGSLFRAIKPVSESVRQKAGREQLQLLSSVFSFEDLHICGGFCVTGRAENRMEKEERCPCCLAST